MKHPKYIGNTYNIYRILKLYHRDACKLTLPNDLLCTYCINAISMTFRKWKNPIFGFMHYVYVLERRYIG